MKSEIYSKVSKNGLKGSGTESVSVPDPFNLANALAVIVRPPPPADMSRLGALPVGSSCALAVIHVGVETMKEASFSRVTWIPVAE